MKCSPKQGQVDYSPMDIFVQSNKGDATPQKSARFSVIIDPVSDYILEGDIPTSKSLDTTHNVDSDKTP
ncbi:hypothetical protein AL057_09240 [Pseudomonas amygdali pv. myricae]|nr:hypothetical protein AL057_09240 [Pseudomonas amygdali pv. myricae]RMT46501.1 hypothetical protein ALP46_01531 [Pseudomonas amygdali pv. myricae]RMV05997.1 hypothetical protein ALP18_200303 [Pseudomonas amygdali pv. myricae]